VTGSEAGPHYQWGTMDFFLDNCRSSAAQYGCCVLGFVSDMAPRLYACVIDDAGCQGVLAWHCRWGDPCPGVDHPFHPPRPVEDAQSILNMVIQMLECFGYEVLAASSPAEAIRLAAEHPGRIDLLLTDVVMPGMNGRDLAKKISAVRLEIKCLFMSDGLFEPNNSASILSSGGFSARRNCISVSGLYRKKILRNGKEFRHIHGYVEKRMKS
jgi:CheY-like chemotaxis protein